MILFNMRINEKKNNINRINFIFKNNYFSKMSNTINNYQKFQNLKKKNSLILKNQQNIEKKELNLIFNKKLNILIKRFNIAKSSIKFINEEKKNKLKIKHDHEISILNEKIGRYLKQSYLQKTFKKKGDQTIIEKKYKVSLFKEFSNQNVGTDSEINFKYDSLLNFENEGMELTLNGSDLLYYKVRDTLNVEDKKHILIEYNDQKNFPNYFGSERLRKCIIKYYETK
jgi:PPE-repeat protein